MLLGPGFCAPGNCTSTCDQKSQCDPGKTTLGEICAIFVLKRIQDGAASGATLRSAR